MQLSSFSMSLVCYSCAMLRGSFVADVQQTYRHLLGTFQLFLSEFFVPCKPTCCRSDGTPTMDLIPFRLTSRSFLFTARYSFHYLFLPLLSEICLTNTARVIHPRQTSGHNADVLFLLPQTDSFSTHWHNSDPELCPASMRLNRLSRTYLSNPTW